MKYDVWCMQEHAYVVCFRPLEIAEAQAMELSEASKGDDYFLVQPDDTVVAHFRDGKRTDLVTEAASA